MIRTLQQADGFTIITVDEPRLTAANSPKFKQEVSELIDEGHTRLILDMGTLTFVDSSGLGALVGVLKKLGAAGELAICDLQPAVEQMFKITRMDRVFRIHKAQDAALVAMR